MKNWFYCYDCHEYFQKDAAPVDAIEMKCPECGSDDVTAIETCPICGGPVKNYADDICRDCQNRIVEAILDEVELMLGEDIDYKDALDAAWDYLADVIRNR